MFTIRTPTPTVKIYKYICTPQIPFSCTEHSFMLLFMLISPLHLIHLFHTFDNELDVFQVGEASLCPIPALGSFKLVPSSCSPDCGSSRLPLLASAHSAICLPAECDSASSSTPPRASWSLSPAPHITTASTLHSPHSSVWTRILPARPSVSCLLLLPHSLRLFPQSCHFLFHPGRLAAPSAVPSMWFRGSSAQVCDTTRSSCHLTSPNPVPCPPPSLPSLLVSSVAYPTPLKYCFSPRLSLVSFSFSLHYSLHS